MSSRCWFHHNMPVLSRSATSHPLDAADYVLNNTVLPPSEPQHVSTRQRSSTHRAADHYASHGKIFGGFLMRQACKLPASGFADWRPTHSNPQMNLGSSPPRASVARTADWWLRNRSSFVHRLRYGIAVACPVFLTVCRRSVLFSSSIRVSNTLRYAYE